MNHDDRKKLLTRWLPLLVGIGVAALSLIQWRVLDALEDAHVERTIQSDAEKLEGEISARVKMQAQSLVRMARRWEIQGKPTREAWEEDARLYFEHFPGFQGITWVDDSYRIGWINPLKGNEAAEGLYLGFEKRRLRAMEEARRLREARITPPIELVQGGKGIIIFAPIFTGGRFTGFIDGVFRTQVFLGSMLGNIAPGYFVSISCEGEEIYRRGEVAESAAKWGRERTVTLYGVDWRVRLAPTRSLLAGMRSDADEAMLAAGFAMALIFGLTVRFAQNARRAEEEIRRLNAELETKVEERTRELIEAQEQLVRREKLSILGQLSGSVGHELRNPLGVMSNAVYFLRMVLADADETTKEYLEIIMKEIDNSQRIITDLLDFARTRAPQTRMVTAGELVEQSLGRCTIPECVALRSEVPETLPPLRIDPLQMGQVLQNLITNAVQAMPNGGALRVSARRVLSSEFGVLSSNLEAETLDP
ncbi:MAG: CHASE domain-containing protein, partial [Geobacteraceae bacterium]|nr:CHASE domain-containing protein [Geobacteraceae bacterium]